jgi:integrase
VEANRAVELLRAVFNHASQLVKWNGANPAEKIDKYQERSRDRTLSEDEVGRLNQALMAEPNPYWRAYFPLCLMLGTRKSELLGARWEDIDLGRRTLTIPSTKAGRSLLLPVPGPAMNLLVSLPSYRTSDWVFPGEGRTGHLVEPKKAWARICERAGIKDRRGTWIHDLRRTIGSWLKDKGHDTALIGRVLNHADPASTAVYARLSAEPIRAALEANATVVMAALPAKAAS